MLLRAGCACEPYCNNCNNDIHNSGCQFYNDKYKNYLNNVFSAVGDWFKAMSKDSTNVHFREDWVRLMKDLLFDSEGADFQKFILAYIC